MVLNFLAICSKPPIKYIKYYFLNTKGRIEIVYHLIYNV